MVMQNIIVMNLKYYLQRIIVFHVLFELKIILLNNRNNKLKSSI